MTAGSRAHACPGDRRRGLRGSRQWEAMSDMSKYDDLLHLCWKLYDDEIARFRTLESKATQYLAASSILVAFVGLVFVSLRQVADVSGDHVCVQLNFWVQLNLVMLALLIAAYCLSLYFVVQSFRQMDTKRLSRDQAWIEFFANEEHDDVTVQLALCEKLRQAAEDNVRVGNDKSISLKRARAFAFSWPMMLLLAASLLLALYNSFVV